MHPLRAIQSSRKSSRTKTPADISVADPIGQACQSALFDYIDAISFSSGALARIASEPQPGLCIDELLIVLGRNEERAHEAYVNARAALVERVRSRSEHRPVS